MTKLEQFFSALPDGAFWVTGKMMKELGAALAEDRAVLAQGSGHEIPTVSGRQFVTGDGEASQSRVAFDLVAASATSVRVYAGTVGANYPDGFSAGDTPPYLLTVSDGQYVAIVVSWDFDEDYNLWTVTASSIGAYGAIPEEDSDTSYIPLGSVSITSGVMTVSSLRRGNVDPERCGTNTNFVTSF